MEFFGEWALSCKYDQALPPNQSYVLVSVVLGIIGAKHVLDRDWYRPVHKMWFHATTCIVAIRIRVFGSISVLGVFKAEIAGFSVSGVIHNVIIKSARALEHVPSTSFKGELSVLLVKNILKINCLKGRGRSSFSHRIQLTECRSVKGSVSRRSDIAEHQIRLCGKKESFCEPGHHNVFSLGVDGWHTVIGEVFLTPCIKADEPEITISCCWCEFGPFIVDNHFTQGFIRW